MSIKDSDKILCTICARGGSKGIKNKNIKLLDGKPLIAHTIEQAKDSNMFSNIVVSSDSDSILKVAENYGANVFFKRPAKLATDKSGKLAVIKHALVESESYFNKEFNYHIDLDATSPLRIPSDIINSFKYFIENDFDNLITGSPSHRSPYFNLVEIKNNKVQLCKNSNIVRRQDTPSTYDMNASIYIWKRNILLNSQSLFLDNTGLFIMPKKRSFDIDSELDFKIVEFLLKERRRNAEQ